MPRPQKSLEEQLRLAEEDLQKALRKVEQERARIESIQQQIEDRDMHDIYALTKKKGLTVEQVRKILENE